jgi:arginine exporter protein ArgO
MMAALISGLVAGYGVAIPIGAIAPLLMSLTARTSLKVGAAAALGVATADGIYALVAVLGGASLARWIEPIATPLRIVAVVVLLFIAARIAFGVFRYYRAVDASLGGSAAGAARRDSSIASDPDRPVRDTGGLSTPPRAFGGLLGLTLLNPTTILYFGALVLGWRASGNFNGAQGTVWIAAVFLASASWQLLLAGGGALIGRTLNTPKGRLWTALISSAMIGALAMVVIIR